MPALLVQHGFSPAAFTRCPGDPAYRISVKREPHGLAGAYLHDHVAPCYLIDVAAPGWTFVLQAGPQPVVLISGGVGATPVLAMLHALAAQRFPREVWWVQAARNGEERPFATEVSAQPTRPPHPPAGEPGDGPRCRSLAAT